jgi:hypothetical protein
MPVNLHSNGSHGIALDGTPAFAMYVWDAANSEWAPFDGTGAVSGAGVVVPGPSSISGTITTASVAQTILPAQLTGRAMLEFDNLSSTDTMRINVGAADASATVGWSVPPGASYNMPVNEHWAGKVTVFCATAAEPFQLRSR